MTAFEASKFADCVEKIAQYQIRNAKSDSTARKWVNRLEEVAAVEREHPDHRAVVTQ